MTPAAQIEANAAAHKAVPYLIDLLSFWEAVDNSSCPALKALRDSVGTAEMRDLCISLHPYTDQVWKSYETQFGEFEGAFDWEFLPTMVFHLPWKTSDYNRVPGSYHMTLDLPEAPVMARTIHGYLS